MVEFYVKVFRTSLFLNPWYIYFMFDLMIDAGPKFMIPNPVHYFKVKVTGLMFLYKSFVINFFQFQFIYNFSNCYSFVAWR